jgi:hypothetical protein
MTVKRVKVEYLCPDVKQCGTSSCVHATLHIKNLECTDSYDNCPVCLIERPFRVPPPFLSKEEMLV